MKNINRKFYKLRLINDIASFFLYLFFNKNLINPKGKNILILNLHLLGDAVLDFPLIEAVGKKNRNAKIVYLTGSWNKPLFSTIKIDFQVIYLDCPWIKKGSFIGFIKQLYILKKKLKCLSWSYCIDIRGDFRNILILFYLQVGGIVSFAWTGGKYLLSLEVKDDSQYKHLAEHHVAILNTIGINFKISNYIPSFFLLKKNVSYDDFSALIHFGASLPLRSMPLSMAADVLCVIRKSHKKILFVIDPDQTVLYTNEVEKILKSLNFIFKLWKGSLGELISVIDTIPNIYAMDSGIAHLSSALGKKVVVFFGPSDKRIVGPLGKKVTYINGQKDFTGPCSNCDQVICKSFEKLKCYSDIKHKFK